MNSAKLAASRSKSQAAVTLVTGGSGFIGSHLRAAMAVSGLVLRCPELRLGAATGWPEALGGVDSVVHLAARVHVMRERARDPLREFRAVNVAGTACLARHAAAAGVKRFIFLSTIGVHGNDSGSGAFREGDPPNPCSPYSISKLEAERQLQTISTETGMELVTLRAPTVYGPRNRGNFLSLLRLVSMGMPLPFARVQNRRSLLYVGNLVDAILACRSHPSAAGQAFLVSDGEDLATPELVRRLAKALGHSPRLFPAPSALLKIAADAFGRRAAGKALLSSLSVDSGMIRKTIGWAPPFSLADGLSTTAAWYLAQGKA